MVSSPSSVPAAPVGEWPRPARFNIGKLEEMGPDFTSDNRWSLLAEASTGEELETFVSEFQSNGSMAYKLPRSFRLSGRKVCDDSARLGFPQIAAGLR